MRQMQVLVLGPEGPGVRALAETLRRLGCAVRTAAPRPGRALPTGGEAVMVDLREGPVDWAPPTRELREDPRPLALVCDRPREAIGALADRPAGALLLTGAESPAGYRVALGVCAGLLRGTLAPPGAGAGRAAHAAARAPHACLPQPSWVSARMSGRPRAR